MAENSGAAAPNAPVMPDDNSALISDPDPGRGFDRDRLLADDLLKGADAIAEFMGLNRRQIYHLAEKSRLPVFRLGSVLCARKSTLTTWIGDQERRAVGGAV